MKKIYIGIVFLLGCVLGAWLLWQLQYEGESTPVTPKNTNSTSEKTADVRYSNLSDVQTQARVKQLLKDYGITEEHIENYFYYVDYFNDAVEGEGLTGTGFQTLTNMSRDGGYPLYLEKLEQKNIDFMGTNCRISSFTLFQDMLHIDHLIQEAPRTLVFDRDAIEFFPKQIFSEETQEKFYTFFAGISTELTTDKDIHLKNIQAYWKEHNIKFQTPPGMSIISMFYHSDLDNELFIGHIGVLFESEGEYIFLEKLAFDLPYQAVIFPKKSQVADYLMKKYGDMTIENTANPFLMENDREFEGEIPSTKNIELEHPQDGGGTSFGSYFQSYDAGIYEGETSLSFDNSEATKARKRSDTRFEDPWQHAQQYRFPYSEKGEAYLNTPWSHYRLKRVIDEQGQKYIVYLGEKEVYASSKTEFITQSPFKNFIVDQTGWWLLYDENSSGEEGFHSQTKLIHNGEELINESSFGLYSLQGKTFYFFQKDTTSTLQYYLDGKIYDTPFDSIIHDKCCEPAAFNMQVSSDGRLIFWGVQEGKLSLNHVILPSFVSWKTAQEMILSGKVQSIFQSHSLRVQLELQNGETLTTIEPKIDAVFDVIQQCGKLCKDIELATE